MLVDSRTVELTRSFYEWELRGRGWATYPNTVALEPPFKPFLGHGLPSDRPVDDSRRETWLSSLVGGLLGSKEQPSDTLTPAPESPDPEPRPGEAVELDELVIALPEDTRVPPAALLGWVRSLATASGPMSFELLGGGERVEVRLAIGETDTAHVTSQLRAVLPSAVVLPIR